MEVDSSGHVASQTDELPATRASSDGQLPDTSTHLECYPCDSTITAHEWIRRLELSREAGSWSEAKVKDVLLTKLSGEPLVWHLAYGERIEPFETWKAEFLKMFSVGPCLLTQPVWEDQANPAKDPEMHGLVQRILPKIAIAKQLKICLHDLGNFIFADLPPQESDHLTDALRTYHYRKSSDIFNDVERIVKFHHKLDAAKKQENVYRHPLYWVKETNGKVPKNAIKGGFDSNKDDLFIARAICDGGVILGKVRQGLGACFMPWRNTEMVAHQYEVLVADCESDFQWVKASRGDLPSGAIQGGWTPKCERLYIGRTGHADSLTPGFVQFNTKRCQIGHGWRTHSYENYEVLTMKAFFMDQ